MTKKAEASFLPEGYETPSAGGDYFKIEKGENRFRVLSSPIYGWVGWNDKEPQRYLFDGKVEADEYDEHGRARFFWALVVWNYDLERPQILELTQKTIISVIEEYSKSEDWGHPKNYDLVIKKEGEGRDGTKYSVIVKPKKKLSADVLKVCKEYKIDLQKLYDNEDPYLDRPGAGEAAEEEEDFEAQIQKETKGKKSTSKKKAKAPDPEPEEEAEEEDDDLPY